MAVEARLNWTEGLQFVGRVGEGPAVILDTPDGGGGPSPMGMVLIGVAGCSGMDVVSILRKQRSPFTNLSIHIRGERQEAYPQRYSAVHIEFRVGGEGIKDSDVERAINLSISKYCGALASLNAEVTHSYRIISAQDPEPL